MTSLKTAAKETSREVEHQELPHAHLFVHLKWRQEKRERRKTDLVDITCNEETMQMVIKMSLIW